MNFGNNLTINLRWHPVYLMAVSRKGHRPVLHRGHCNTWIKYLFTVLGASQGGLVTSRLYMTCRKFLRKTDVAFPCDMMSRQQMTFERFGFIVRMSKHSLVQWYQKMKNDTKKVATKTQKTVVKCAILSCRPWGAGSSRWEFLQSGNSGPTCCAYSRRESRYGAGGSKPGNTALLIESKASMKNPHSIIVPTFLKSVSVAWRKKRTMMKRKRYMERRRKHGTQRDGRAKEEKKAGAGG